MNMKGNKRDLVKKYGKDAEAVMYGRATNMAKKQTKEMRDPKLTELIKDALKNPKKADLNKDGKLSDYEKTRGSAIEKNLKETLDEKAWGKLDRLRDAIDDDDYIIQSLMKALSTDDANLYLDSMIRDHIDIVDGEEGEESVYGDKVIDLEEVELPSTIIQKLANEIKDPQGFAKAMLGIYNAIQDKEQKDYSKNQKFGRVLNYLNDIADDEKEEVSEDTDMNDPFNIRVRVMKQGC